MAERSLMERFDEAELGRVPAAIKKAETKTQAEIFAVLTERSDTYRFVAYSFLVLWILLFSAILALYLQWSSYSDATNVWGSGHEGFVGVLPLGLFIFAQIAAYVCGIIIIRTFPRLAVLMTPDRIAQERAHANGVRQFLAHGIHNTKGRTGVLVFVSLDERYGEIFVDTAIENAVGREFFLEQIGELIETCRTGDVVGAYEKVIGQIGEKLADAFPVLPDDENELDNRFIIL